VTTGSAAPPSAPPAGTRWLWIVRIALFLWLLALTALVYRGAPGELVLFAVIFAGVLLGLFSKVRRRALAWAFGAATVTFVFLAVGLVEFLSEADRGLIEFLIVLAVIQAALAAGALKAFYALGREKGDWRKLTEGTLIPAVLLLIFIPFGMKTDTDMRREKDQASAVGSLRTINSAETTYAQTYRTCFTPSLAALAPPPAGAQPSASAPGLIDKWLASGVRNGYRFTYAPGPHDKAGCIQSYTLSARPLEYGLTGRKNFFTDQSGVIRETSEDRPATVEDPATGGREP
jgi:type IV pilus assembly protein PilA